VRCVDGVAYRTPRYATMYAMPRRATIDNLDAACTWIIDGGPLTPTFPDAPSPTLVIAVDRGGRHALSLGLHVDVLVGDLDSIGPEAHDALVAQGAEVERHPSDKDRSDLDLAITRAAQLDPGRIELVAAGGGRLDHQLVAAQLLARPDVAALPITAHIGEATLAATCAGDHHVLAGAPGDFTTLMGMGGVARVETHGLRWNLAADIPLEPGSTLGLSNVIVDSPAGFDVVEGIVLSIVTGTATAQ
jgi:thiamine pyrophosphokinase